MQPAPDDLGYDQAKDAFLAVADLVTPASHETFVSQIEPRTQPVALVA